MKINDLSDVLEDVYFDHDFLVMIETHMTYLRSSDKVRVQNIKELQAYKYEGAFFDLLDDLNINKKFHYIVLRFNGYVSSADFKADTNYILLPDFNEIELLKNIFLTKK